MCELGENAKFSLAEFLSAALRRWGGKRGKKKKSYEKKREGEGKPFFAFSSTLSFQKRAIEGRKGGIRADNAAWLLLSFFFPHHPGIGIGKREYKKKKKRGECHSASSYAFVQSTKKEGS